MNAFLSALTAIPADVMARLPGGEVSQYIVVASPPFAAADNVTGSDLNIYERAWVRAAYRWMRANGTGYSLKIDWQGRTPAGRGALVRIMPYGQAPAAESYSLNFDLRSQYRRTG